MIFEIPRFIHEVEDAAMVIALDEKVATCGSYGMTMSPRLVSNEIKTPKLRFILVDIDEEGDLERVIEKCASN